jgi:hypothetical protein
MMPEMEDSELLDLSMHREELTIYKSIFGNTLPPHWIAT